ncbi:MAG: hypothetical protein REI11_11610 [Patulibacter sp.]|nr:hypothetical protein [Patulibacter sp.]
MAVVTHARATGREWHDIADRIGDRDARSLARVAGDDVRRLQREVLFPRRAGGDTACPEWWGLPAGMEAPERLLRQLDAHAALVGTPLISSRLEAPHPGALDSAVELLEQLKVDVAAHRLTILYAGAGADKSPLPIGVTERDVVERLDRYRAAADCLSASA